MGGDVAEFIHQTEELAQIGAELRGRHGGIFPALPQFSDARNICTRAERRFTDAPDTLGKFTIHTGHVRDSLPAGGSLNEIFGLRESVTSSVCSELNQQEAPALRQ